MASSGERQRIDRWLWHARVVRTRTSAAALAQSGHVRVNGQRIDSSGRAIKTGDVLTIAFPNAVRILRVLGFTVRRGACGAARMLYEDISPPPVPKPVIQKIMEREPGSGRPTKKDRRAIDRLRHRSQDLDG